MPLLAVHNLTVSRGRTRIVRGLSFDVRAGQTVALLGPNGAGKTTLLHACMGLVPTEAPSDIQLSGTSITDWRTDQRVSAGLALVPQHTSLFRELSVQDNLDVIYDYHQQWRSVDRDEFAEECHEYLRLTGLEKMKSRQAGVLSGGQKRKLEVIRALLMHPRLIMCDEPFAGVDPKSIAELQELFDHLVATHGISMLISDHNVDQLLTHSQFLYVVLDGEIVAKGDPETVMADEVTRERYLGKGFGR
jgi:lipopolysaccharide export system ATP-binding protein